MPLRSSVKTQKEFHLIWGSLRDHFTLLYFTLPGKHCTFDSCFFQSQKLFVSAPLRYSIVILIIVWTFHKAYLHPSDIFCTPRVDRTSHPPLWDTYKGESMDGAILNTHKHTISVLFLKNFFLEKM